MGKLYISLEDDLNLVDLIRGQVSRVLEILLQSPKTKAEYAKSFSTALQVVQNMDKLLNFSNQTTDDNSENPEQVEQERTNFDPATTVTNKGGTKRSKIADFSKTKNARSSPSPVDGRPPQQKALANSLIVQKIMENVTSRTLTSCRMVCSVWMEEATKQLLTPDHHQFLEVKFRWSENNGEYQHISLGTLQSFLDHCLKKSRRFPCVQFNFDRGCLSSPAFLNFFTDFGANLRFFRLRPTTNNDGESSLALKTLGEVLFKLAPNLEGLTLHSMDWTRGIGFPKQVGIPIKKGKRRGFQKLKKIQQDILQMAPNLKKLTLPLQRNRFPAENAEMNPALLYLLKRAPNLERIDDRNLYFTREIVAAGKFGLVKSLLFYFDHATVEIDDRYVYFSEQGPKLETVEFLRRPYFSWSSSVARSCMTDILRSSQNTLKTVVGLDQADLQSYQIPHFQNVNFLNLKPYDSISIGPILPRGKKLVDCFPNLTTIKCPSRILQNPANASKTVDRLYLTMEKSCPKVISDAESLYPNLKLISLKIVDDRAGNLPETVKAVCSSFPRLEILRIKMTVSNGWFRAAEMDAAFTGLSPSKCKDLTERQREIPDAKILKILEINGQPSIRNLTKLKELQVCLKQRNPQIQVHRLCTRVTDLYAFDLMKRRQGLNVLETVQNWS